MLAEDPALLAAFLDESQESLSGLEARLIDLDGAADVRSEVEAIFRPVHTLKGNAPFFGFMEVQRLAHALETILDHLRKGRMERSKSVTDVLLAGLDGLRGCIERIRAGEPEVADASVFNALIARVTSHGDGGKSSDPWTQVFAELADIERRSDQFDPATLAQIARLRTSLTNVRGSAPAKSTATSATHNPDEQAKNLRRRLATPIKETLDAESAATVMTELQALRAICQDPAQGTALDHIMATCQVFLNSIGFDDMVRKYVIEGLDQICFAPTVATPTSATPDTPDTRAKESTSERRTRTDSESHGKSMRVSEAAVDGFLAHVGELLVIGDQLEHLQRRLATSLTEMSLARDMRQVVASFAVLSTELQRSIMSVRRVPIRGLLQKAPRLVRDIAQATTKNITVVIEGDSEEIDKGRLDLLDGPLTHLVRNCADHGIELPADRIAAGKSERGTITLKASSHDGWFTLEISDDGKGLNLEAIRRKGESLGLISAGANLDERTIIDLIFASGLSTADKVSDVSGRGVGMDVVKRQISEAGGNITVTTASGKGSSFCVRLPSAVSTQIIPAFLIRDGNGLFALPLDLVRESFVDPEAQAANGVSVVMRHGKVLPVAPLGQVLGQRANSKNDGCLRTFVTVEWKNSTVAVSVDETIGVRRLVIRQLTGTTANSLDGRFQGAALLGDGQLALVIEPDHLLALIHRSGSYV